MHRIDGAGATMDGLFTEGDPTTAVPATTVTGAWLNAVQEEIAGVIEGAGLELDKPDNGQLLEAIQAIIAANLVQAWYTGDVRLTMRATADAGWVMCNDGTIGDAGSGATARADTDTEDLFTLLWNNVADGFAPVSGGRGASAAADFAAGKTIGLTKMLGRALAVAGSGSGLSPRDLGQTVGAETHTLTESEMPLHGHPWRASTADNGSSDSTGGLMTDATSQVARSAFTGTPAATAGQQIGGTGGGQAHANMQPTAFLYAMIKL
jgi:microcystin-dependent protein